ncbi:MAG TPA: CRISPR-associated endonuclease Cas2 [Candidatus Nocardiopsis merdipullorum]|nr:CRISPR-associated endonuclease Cas2 [Candidatus Nocardiopsis merdipullorum]
MALAFSVGLFEAEVFSPHVFDELREALKEAIEPGEDQVRVYPLRIPDLDKVMVLGERRLEERQDFWIVSEGACTPNPVRVPEG